MAPLLEVSGLSVDYGLGKNRILAVDNGSLTIPSEGYALSLVGESGCGKTTLGMSILNLVPRPGRIVNGSIRFDGQDILKMDREALRRYRGRDVSMVYQSAMSSLNPMKSVRDHVVEMLQEHGDDTKAEAVEKATQLLVQAGIKEERVDSFPHEFSGGMKQRAVIAMALSLSPKLLIADEPTSALDVVTQVQILELLKKQIREKKLAVIFITHEISLAPILTEYTAVMHSGAVVELGSTRDVLSNPLHPYTETMVQSLLTMKSTPDVLGHQDVAQGTDEAPPYAACPYSGKCRYAFDRCRGERPVLREVEKGRWVACHRY
jgi:oligopeptide/dipeptide ABC transporter ATP-binding protein